MIFLFIILGFLCIVSISFRTVLFNPLSSAFYLVKDLVLFFVHLEWRRCKTGELVAYCGLFGKGKTLSAVHHVRKLYNRYNDKKIWDRDRHKWVTQKIYILSNVDLLGIPYHELQSLSQVVEFTKINRDMDYENDTLTCCIVLGDEFSVQMNSRNFKSNIDALFLNTLLTCRHHHISLIYTAQRFQNVDKLLRDVTNHVIQCDKVWRVMASKKYDAWELENASTPLNCKPLMRYGWFVHDKDYNSYDTLACVGNLVKSMEEGDMISAEEILQLLSPSQSDMDAVVHVSNRVKRQRKKERKKGA